MSAETIVALIEGFGPFGAVGLVLAFLLMRPQFNTPRTSSDDFSAEQKLWLKENVIEPIIKAIKT
jgi:hypothetical protein